MVRYLFANCEVDSARRVLLRDGSPAALSQRAFKALLFLLERHPAAISREVLYERLWAQTFVADENLNNVIAEIRRALADEERKVIVTLYGFGYSIGVPVRCEKGPSDGNPSRFQVWISGERLTLWEGENLVGRTAEAAIHLEDSSVSRRHALIRINEGRAEVEDLESRNGTFVDSDRVAGGRELRDGESMRFGDVVGVLRILDDSESTAPGTWPSRDLEA